MFDDQPPLTAEQRARAAEIAAEAKLAAAARQHEKALAAVRNRLAAAVEVNNHAEIDRHAADLARLERPPTAVGDPSGATRTTPPPADPDAANG